MDDVEESQGDVGDGDKVQGSDDDDDDQDPDSSRKSTTR